MKEPHSVTRHEGNKMLMAEFIKSCILIARNKHAKSLHYEFGPHLVPQTRKFLKSVSFSRCCESIDLEPQPFIKAGLETK